MTADGAVFHQHKAKGMARDVFRTRNMRDLFGNAGIGHVRYPTAGSAVSEHEAQPFYVNSPFGISLVHNGNLTNGEQLKADLFKRSTHAISTPTATAKCCSTCWRWNSSALRAGGHTDARDDLQDGRCGASALLRRRGDGDDRRLRHTGVPRSAWHPAHGLWPQRNKWPGRNMWSPARRWRLTCWLSVCARHRAGRSAVHRLRGHARTAVRAEPEAQSPASSNTSTLPGRFGDRRHQRVRRPRPPGS